MACSRDRSRARFLLAWPRPACPARTGVAMTEAARDLYLLVAVLGLLPAVSLAGMPVLAQSAFVAVGGVGALQLERAGLPIGGAVLVAIGLGALAGAGTGALTARA